MVIHCEYANIQLYHGVVCYRCLINRAQPPENRRLEIGGAHENGMTNNDVNQVSFNYGIVNKIPKELTLIYPNLKNLTIYNAKLSRICKNDLVEYKNLELISLRDNELVYLPGDLFEDFKFLNYINFERNKLTLIEPNILNGLEEIKFVSFSENPRYEKWHSTLFVHEANNTLEEVKNELYEKFYSKFNFLEDNKKLQDSMKLTSKMNCNEFKEKVTKSSIADDFKSYIQDENCKDFKINIDEREFFVHKFLLIIRSPTLADILQSNPEVENLNLVDIPVSTFEIILNFLYTDKLPDQSYVNYLQLFAAAGRLKIKNLTDYAAEKLFSQINSANSLEILSLSNKLKYDELKLKAFKEFKKKHPNVKDEWLENQEKLNNVIEIFKEKEDAIRKFEEMFNEISEI